MTTQQIQDLLEKVLSYEVDQLIPREDVIEWYGRKVATRTPCWHVFAMDRNWCHEVLAKLTDERRYRFTLALEAIVSVKVPDGSPAAGHSRFSEIVWRCLTATPAQITEAVWRATCQ